MFLQIYIFVIYPESHMTKRKLAESLLISKHQQHVMDGNINSFRLRVFRQLHSSDFVF